MNKLALLLLSIVFTGVMAFSFTNYSERVFPPSPYHSLSVDTLPPIEEREGDFITDPNDNPFDLEDPSVIEQEVEYDPESNSYIIYETIGEEYFRTPTYMSFEEYLEYTAQQEQQSYFNDLARQSTGSFGGVGLQDPIIDLGEEKDMFTRIFGDGGIQIKPTGNIDVTLGADFQRVENPILPERQRRQGGFNFDMGINLNVTGQIGDLMKLNTAYNTQATFDFDNQINLNYEGQEDDIIKKMEAGNVSFPLPTSLVQGSQALFGFRSDLQFGRLYLSSVISQQKSKRDEIVIQGGSQLQEFNVTADEYDENRHFFLSHYNRSQYEGALENLPQIKSLFKITKIEVWVTNRRNQTEGPRDIVAIADLGEGTRIANPNPSLQAPSIPRDPDIFNNPLPTNDANDIYETIINDPLARNIDNAVNRLQSVYGFQQGKDFEKLRARPLSPNEFTYHPDLGYISLNVNLQPDDVLGVSYEYTYNGEVHRVGEFANDVFNADTLGVLYVKMLKSTTPRVDLPMWDLMMKNIYSLGAYQINNEDFRLDVFYEDPGGGEIRSLPSTNIQGIPLIRLLNLDNLNTTGDPQPDGVFDFVEGVTINSRNGRLIFPVLEPFGSSLSNLIDDPIQADFYAYQQLYDSTVIIAREYPELNRYAIRGRYKSSVSSEISLGAFNLPRGSVIVRAGGQILQEGQDYTVDYNIGRVKIINDAYLNSGQPIRVSFEDNTLFSFQTKTMVGLRADYKISDDFVIGGTFMKLWERPFTQKVNIGDDPINNNIYGADVQYSTDAPWLTRMVDKIPLIDTKAPSSIDFYAEAAFLKPGHASAIEQENEGIAYIDDFEGSTSSFDLRTPANKWVLASVPQNDADNNNPLFPEASQVDTILSGVNRAQLSWYSIDQTGINASTGASVYSERVLQDDIFKNFTNNGFNSNLIRTFDITYNPRERGPYNFDMPGDGTAFSSGLADNGQLKDPDTRWGGIMRDLRTTNFEAANIEFVEFWLLSPFLPEADGTQSEVEDGTIYLNLGNISEDVMRDSRLFFENGLPAGDEDIRVDTTSWGRIPRVQAITNAFDNAKRDEQDVGLDGLDDEGELAIFDDYVAAITARATMPQQIKDEILGDVANDNFLYYNAEFWDNLGANVIQRYSRFNKPQGNSQEAGTTAQTISSGTNIPDTEDINQDNTLNETEAYFQYAIPIERDGDEIKFNQFVTEKVEYESDGKTFKWYRFKVPVQEFTSKVGGIQDFRSIRFIRMYLKGFNAQSTFRFARLELVRNQWRRYLRTIVEDDGATNNPGADEGTVFDVNAVNFEENSEKTPFNYVLPPGVLREQQIGSPFPNALQNEQSLSMNVCNLIDGQAKAIYKNINFDFRLYKRLKMFVHAESVEHTESDDLTLFIRMGSDFERNYYEYEIPLKMSELDLGISPESDAYKELVWPDSNELDIDLELLKELKVLRNNQGYPLNQAFSGISVPGRPNHVIKVKGNPNLGLIKTIMIGIRNPQDDGLSHCAEIWVNELRVSGFDERGGWGALSRLDMQLADFGNINTSINYTTIGFGGLEQKLAQRSREDILQYDVAGNFELGKFFPEKWGIKIPVYAQYSNVTKTPQFDPYDYDIELDDKLASINDTAVRDSIKNAAQDVTEIKSFNVSNLRKERTGGAGKKQSEPQPWDIENLSVTYAYSETTRHDPTIENDELTDHQGILDYNYSRSPLYIEPFKNTIKKPEVAKYFKFFTDLHLNPVPNSFSFSTRLHRQFQATTYRFADPSENTFYNKRFTWDRNYDVKWDLTRSLRLTLNAQNSAMIDEPPGLIDTQIEKDSIWTNFRDFGRNKNYQHTANLSYDVPLKNIPYLDFMKVRAQYNASFAWNAAALNVDSLGNIIQNGQTRQVNADFNFEKLYNNFSYLKKINSKPKGKGKSKKPDDKRGRTGKDNDNPDSDADNKSDKKKKDREPTLAERIIIRPLMLIRKGRFSYEERFSSVVPGFMPQTNILGMDQAFNAPGWGYVTGWTQPTEDWLFDNQTWITSSVFLNQEVLRTYTQSINAEITLEPVEDFKIDIEANRDFTKNTSAFFKVADPSLGYQYLTEQEMGSFSVSYLPIRTLFQDDLFTTFSQFEQNREIISQRLGTELGITNPHDIDEQYGDYTEGFGRTQQDVLIPAFVAAYSGIDANTIGLDVFETMPMPNWNVSYRGLSKLDAFKKIFRNITIEHGYQSFLTVNSFATDLHFDRNAPQSKNITNQNYYARFEVPNIVINESLSPLIGVDLKFNNDINVSFDWKKSRNLSMSFTDFQLSEQKTEEIIASFGYRIKDVYIKFLDFDFSFDGIQIGGAKNPDTNKPNNSGKKKKGSDMNIKFEFSFRDDITINHLLDQNVRVPTRGLKSIRISPSIDYSINKNLNVRLFYDYSRTIPATSASFPISNTQAGMTIRFSLN